MFKQVTVDFVEGFAGNMSSDSKLGCQVLHSLSDSDGANPERLANMMLTQMLMRSSSRSSPTLLLGRCNSHGLTLAWALAKQPEPCSMFGHVRNAAAVLTALVLFLG